MAQRHELVIAGVGGRGVLVAGQLLLEAGKSQYKHVLSFANYSGAMRGTESEITVILSDEEIKSPVMLNPQTVMILSPWGLVAFEERVKSGGMIFVDSTICPGKVNRDDAQVFYLPATEVAQGLGAALAGNLVLLGAYVGMTKAVPLELVDEAINNVMAAGRREALLPINKRALREGARLMANYRDQGD